MRMALATPETVFDLKKKDSIVLGNKETISRDDIYLPLRLRIVPSRPWRIVALISWQGLKSHLRTTNQWRGSRMVDCIFSRRNHDRFVWIGWIEQSALGTRTRFTIRSIWHFTAIWLARSVPIKRHPVRSWRMANICTSRWKSRRFRWRYQR